MQTLIDFGIRSVREVRTARLFVIDVSLEGAAERGAAERVAKELLADPVAEVWSARRQGEALRELEGALAIEVHFKPGVMDNVARRRCWRWRTWG
jgi:phosphoribosylformylglycinamidine (FGAM) synthase PurS component